MDDGELKMEKAGGLVLPLRWPKKQVSRRGVSVDFVSTVPYEASAKRRSQFEEASRAAAVFVFLLPARYSLLVTRYCHAY